MCKHTFGKYKFWYWKVWNDLVQESDLTTLFIKCRSVAERFYKNLQKNRTKNFGIVLQTQQTRFKQALNVKFLGNSVS